MRVFVSVFQPDSATTPLIEHGRDEFAVLRRVDRDDDNPTIRDFVIGNEPNLNRFWMPQFGPDGSDAAATAYLALLARTYDALKKVSPKTR